MIGFPPYRFVAPAVLALLVSTRLAAGQSWQSAVANNGVAAFATVQVGSKILGVGCNKNLGPKLFLTLSGGPHEGMRNVDDTDDSMMMWIQLSDGRLARHPIDGHYVGGEQTFVGELPTTAPVMNEFAGGSKVEFTSVSGAVIFSAPMTGTAKARANFAQACGI
ncbi:MAG: hypothetical protein AAGH83_02465 [Pseudomonadota bacterium]